MQWILLAGGVGIIAILIFLAKKKFSAFLNFLLRIVYGFLAIYLANMGFAHLGIEVFVGFNPVTALTLGSLGISGFFLLYGVMLGNFL